MFDASMSKKNALQLRKVIDWFPIEFCFVVVECSDFVFVVVVVQIDSSNGNDPRTDIAHNLGEEKNRNK